MKNLSLFSVLLLLASLATPLFAEKYVPQKAEDLLRDVMIFDRPADFATAQQLAYQSRADRVARVQEIMACIDQAANMDDFEACQVKEAEALAKIRLAYCNTNVSWPDKNKVQSRAEAKGVNKLIFDASECEKAMANLTGTPIRKRNKGDAASDVEVISEEQGGEP